MSSLSRLLLTGLISLLLAGCETIGGWFDEDEYDPTQPVELTDIDTKVKLNRRWSTSVGDGQGKGLYKIMPVLEDGVLYVAAAEGDLMAVDAESGRKLWSVNVDLRISGGVGKYGDSLFLGGADGLVIRLDANSGAEIWRAEVSGEVLAAPQGNGDLVVAQTYDGKLIGLDYETGSQRWAHLSDVPVLTLRGTATPLIVDSFAIAAFADGKVLAISLDNGSGPGRRGLPYPRAGLKLNALLISTAVWLPRAWSSMSPVTRAASQLWKCERVARYGSATCLRYRVFRWVSAMFTWRIRTAPSVLICAMDRASVGKTSSSATAG